MSTITLSVPSEVAALIEADEGARRRLERIAALLFQKSQTLTEDDLGSLDRALKQADAGETVSADVFFADLYRAVGLPQPASFEETVFSSR